MRTQTFTHNGATITVKRAVIRDRLAANLIIAALDIGFDPLERYAASEFAQCVARTTNIDGDIGFTVPGVNATASELKAGLEAWLEADASLLVEWQSALNLVNISPNDPDLTPTTPEKKEANQAS